MALHSGPGNDLNLGAGLTKPRKAAADCVYAVCEQGESLDAALLMFASGLPARDAALCQALCYGSIRSYLAYRAYLDRQLKKPFKPKDKILYAVLVSALFQLDDTQHAAHAVVNEAVALTRDYKRQWAAGLVNALLRNYLRAPGSRPSKDTTEWLRQTYPGWLVAQIEAAWPAQTDAILRASLALPPMTLRVNRQVATVHDYIASLAKPDIPALRCKDAIDGLTLKRPVPVQKLPGFDSAMVSVQDESAQLAAPCLDLRPGQRVLDACAAPGGKSLHILELEPDIQNLDLLDFAHRLPRLRENLRRAGKQARVIEGDLLAAETWFDGEQYDRILIDAPCTGSGVMRRHPDIKFRRQAENGLQFASRQLEMLDHAWRLLKPGGKLLYTTCSILPAENEHCAARFAAQTLDARSIDLPEFLGIKTEHGRQRLPGLHPGDGFFYALFARVPNPS